jgi:uncharacterized membrane protein YqiK
MYATLQTCGSKPNLRYVPAYICHQHKKEGKARCAQKLAQVEDIDAKVFKHVRQAAKQGRFHRLLQPHMPPDITDLDAKLHAITAQLERLQVANQHLADSAILKARLATVTANQAQLTAERERHARSHRLPSGPRWQLLQHIDTLWTQSTVAVQRDLVA